MELSKATWLVFYDERRTGPAPGDRVSRVESFASRESADARILELPHRGAYSIPVVVPEEHTREAESAIISLEI